jgi:hypothetical protein
MTDHGRAGPLAGPERIVIAASIRWTVPPPVALASRMRELLSGIYKDLLEPEEMHSVAMAAHELIENLVKYSASGTSSFDVEICDGSGRARVCLRTRNRASAHDADRVRDLVERLSSSPDPMLVYDELVATSPRRAGSGMGLARICAEGEMNMACLAEDGHITITAERPVSISREA